MDEPISLEQAIAHLRTGDLTSDEEDYVNAQIAASREWVEDYTGLYLAEREVTESLNAFGDRLRLRAWPIVASEPITLVYRDHLGVEQTISDATLRATARPAGIYPALNARWPLNCTLGGPIEVSFTAGYEDPADIPQVLRSAMLVMLTAFYDDREGGETFAKAEETAKRLCRRYKRRTL